MVISLIPKYLGTLFLNWSIKTRRCKMKGIEQPIKQPVKAEETTKTVESFVKKKDEAQTKKSPPPQKDQPLLKVDEQYQELCNIQYVQDSGARKELFWIIDELRKIPDIKLEKTGDHDLSIKAKGRTLVKVCPLKKSWSAAIVGGKIQSYTKEQILSGVRVAQVADKETPPQKTPEEDKKVIEKLEDRIAKMDKQSKGINIKGIKVTLGVKEWAKTKGYTIDGTTLLVQ